MSLYNYLKNKKDNIKSLYVAINNNDLITVKKILNTNNFNINCVFDGIYDQDIHHLTPLKLAIKMGYYDITKYILEQKNISVNFTGILNEHFDEQYLDEKNINSDDTNNWIYLNQEQNITPLYTACFYDETKIFFELIKKDADINKLYQNINFDKSSNHSNNILLKICSNGNIAIFNYLYENLQLKFNLDDSLVEHLLMCTCKQEKKIITKYQNYNDIVLLLLVCYKKPNKNFLISCENTYLMNCKIYDNIIIHKIDLIINDV